MSCGLLGPSISRSPALTRSPSCTLTWTPRGIRYSALLRARLVRDDDDLALALDDAAHLHGAVDLADDRGGSRGLRASNSSTTRGRPPVMSLVFVVSRGIFASTWPANTVSPSSTIRCACDGMWYLRSTLCAVGVDRISISGCFFSSGESMMIRRARPVTSSTSSWTVRPSMMSLNFTVPGSSVRIENVYGSHSTSTWPCSTLLAVRDAQARAVDHLIALAVAALRVLHHDAARAVHRPPARPSASARP